MDSNITPSSQPTQTQEPFIMAQSREPATHGPVVPPKQETIKPSKAKPKLVVWVGLVLLCIMVFMLIGISRRTASVTEPSIVQPTPTPTVVPAPMRPLTPFATESAFLEFEVKLDEVTRGIQNAPIDNQSLLPPTLDLPLGY